MRYRLDTRYIVIHTAAYEPEVTVSEINRWHQARGFSEIGYHFVIHQNGAISKGRALHKVGAHCRCLNAISVGICFTGHGDIKPFTDRQSDSGVRLCAALLQQYNNVKIDRIIGHREVNDLVERNILPKGCLTNKTCPGLLVNMAEFRRKVLMQTKHIIS
jgi:N-acetyl-anhydromuramyl-L-alanine amidase AmpD